MKIGDIIGVVFLIVFTVAAFLFAGIVWDEMTMSGDSVDARIALLEEQMKEKSRPVIRINRGTVYNTDGEIVIEGIKDRSQ